MSTNFLLRIVGHIGTITFATSAILAIYYLIRYTTEHIHVSGWITLVLIVLFTNGLSLFSVGIVGRYPIVNINEIKRLPKCSIKEKSVEKKRVTK